MPKSTAHFDEPLQDWTRRKHAILEGYLPTFCTALAGTARGQPIWYIDGYAGAGAYQYPNDPDAQKSPGSPIIAAMVAQKHSYDVRCLNIESDPDVFARLQQETASFPHVKNIKDDFIVIGPRVLHHVAASPAFFFLDPFGVADLPMTGVVERIAQRQTPTDILLRYDFETVRRLIGSAMKDPKRGDSNAQHLDNWFRGDDWRQIDANTSSPQQRDLELLAYYKRQLTSISRGRLKFVVDYPIRTTDGKVKYYLVFATKDRLGIKLMSQVLYKAESEFNSEREAYEDEKIKGQKTLFSLLDPTPEDKYAGHVRSIAQTIQDIGKTKGTGWNFDALFCELILAHGWCGRVSEKDFRNALKHLHTEGKLDRLSLGNGWSKATEFQIKT